MSKVIDAMSSCVRVLVLVLHWAVLALLSKESMTVTQRGPHSDNIFDDRCKMLSRKLLMLHQTSLSEIILFGSLPLLLTEDRCNRRPAGAGRA